MPPVRDSRRRWPEGVKARIAVEALEAWGVRTALTRCLLPRSLFDSEMDFRTVGNRHPVPFCYRENLVA